MLSVAMVGALPDGSVRMITNDPVTENAAEVRTGRTLALLASVGQSRRGVDLLGWMSLDT